MRDWERERADVVDPTRMSAGDASLALAVVAKAEDVVVVMGDVVM
jgi:hypothetical protein